MLNGSIEDIKTFEVMSGSKTIPAKGSIKLSPNFSNKARVLNKWRGVFVSIGNQSIDTSQIYARIIFRVSSVSTQTCFPVVYIINDSDSDITLATGEIRLYIRYIE